VRYFKMLNPASIYEKREKQGTKQKAKVIKCEQKAILVSRYFQRWKSKYFQRRGYKKIKNA
jgi:hypothetical protein